MPYSYPNNVPRVALHWTEPEKRKCAVAAQAVLSSNGSEQEAIFACIHAAGRTENPGGKTMSWLQKVAAAFGDMAERLVSIDAEDDEPGVEKAMWDTAMVNDLPDSCFLYIEPGKGKDSEGKTVPRSARHFPYKNAEGQVDMPHLRNAIARIPQSNAPGLDKQAMQKRAQAMLERMNSGMKEGDGLAIYKQVDGAFRWFGWVSNHYRDRDNPPEILTSKAHRDFVDYVDKTQKFPELWLWHVPGSKIGKADWVDFADGFLMMSGLFDPGKEATAKALSEEVDPLTMSHGFVRLVPMTAQGHTNGYITFEASVTPKGPEANPFTGFNSLKEANMSLSPDKKAFLAKYLPEDTIASLEGKTDELRKAAEAAGVDWKTVEGEDVTGVADTTPTLDMASLGALVDSAVSAKLDSLQLDKLSDLISEMRAESKANTETIAELTAAVKELKKTDDEKIAETLTPKISRVFAWQNRAASKSADTVLKEGDAPDEALKAAKPSWLEMAVQQAQSVR